MYLPSWVVAALAVFRAANMPDSESSLHIAEQGQLRTTAMNKFSFLAEKHDMAKMCLGVTDSKEGEVVKLYVCRSAPTRPSNSQLAILDADLKDRSHRTPADDSLGAQIN